MNPHPIIRKHFDLFANLRPARSRASLPHLHSDVDILVVRENNEGFQPDRNMVAGSGEFQPTEDSAFSLRVITKRQSERIARAGVRSRPPARWQAARDRHPQALGVQADRRTLHGHRRKGLAGLPRHHSGRYQVDTSALHLVMRPQEFDVLLCTNMFGDICPISLRASWAEWALRPR